MVICINRNMPAYAYRRTRKVNKSLSKRKRWFFDASIPKSVPFVGGAGVRFGSGNGKFNKRSLQSVVRNMVLETKLKRINENQADTLHNTVYNVPLLSNIAIGSGKTSRLTDELVVKACHFRLMMGQRVTTPFVPASDLFVRCIVVKTAVQQGAGADTITSGGIGSTDLFQSGSDNLITAVPDYDLCTYLYDEVMVVKAPSVGVGTARGTGFKSFSIPGFKQQYISSSSNYGKAWNYYLVLIPFLEGASTGVTHAAFMQVDILLPFTDGK